MQDAIVALAKRTGMRISGPNAEGFYSQAQRVAATFQPDHRRQARCAAAGREPTRIGIVAQSGGIGFAIYHRAKALGVLPLSYVISAGNESDLGSGEFFEYMVQDPSTDVILLFIEGHPGRRQVPGRRQARGGDWKTRHRDKGRPLRRRRARRGVAYRQHGRLVGGL